tara:strand:- start:372 stop:593 length:222 start_codon:yes stop_codon:yes gene_type:complete
VFFIKSYPFTGRTAKEDLYPGPAPRNFSLYPIKNIRCLAKNELSVKYRICYCMLFFADNCIDPQDKRLTDDKI